MTIIQWQAVSLISKLSAILMGLVGNIIVLRILSPEDWGVIGLAMSVVGAVSVLHHLGLANGLNREIAKEKNVRNIPTIITTALIVRLPVSIAIAITLLLLAQFVALRFYDNMALVVPIQLLATLVVIEGVQDIFSASVGAMKLFRGLFLFQVVLAFIYLVANIVFVSIYGTDGYFYAKYVYAGGGIVLFGMVLLRHFYMQSVNIFIINVANIAVYLRGMLSIGMASFSQKVIHMYWQRIPTLVMGTMFTPTLIGVYNFADFFSQRLGIFADAASDVSLPEFLRSFHDNYEQFKKDYSQNFLRVGVITTLFAVTGGLFLTEFLEITGLNKYDGVQPIFVVSALGMLAYSMVNTSGVIFVAAHARKHMIISFVLIFAVTSLSIFPLASVFGVLGGALAYGMGSLSGLFYVTAVIQRSYGIVLVGLRNMYFFSPLLLLLLIDIPLVGRVVCFVVFILLYFALLRRYNYQTYSLLVRKLPIIMKK